MLYTYTYIDAHSSYISFVEHGNLYLHIHVPTQFLLVAKKETIESCQFNMALPFPGWGVVPQEKHRPLKTFATFFYIKSFRSFSF